MVHCSRFLICCVSPGDLFAGQVTSQGDTGASGCADGCPVGQRCRAHDQKYPNRRLYDTRTSSYITLAEIKKLVMMATPVKVVDAKTGDDLTRTILLQIILEEESAGLPMFSEAVLSNIIRFYGHAMQTHMGSYLESHVQSFMDWQNKLGESSPALSPEVWAQFMQWQTPMMQNMFSGLANPSQSVMVQMQEQMTKQIQKNTEQLLGAMGLRS